MRKSIVAALVVLVAVSSVPAWCQEDAPPPAPAKVDFSGVLFDPKTELAAVGVKLSLVGPGEHLAVSGPGGRFTFKQIAPGTYGYLFAYERGEAEPARTMLLAKSVDVGGDEAEPVRIPHTALLERPEDTKPQMATFVYRDGRERENHRSIVFTESLGIDWPVEYVSYNVGFPAYSCRKPSLRIVDGSTGQELPFQLSNVKYAKGDNLSSCTITFPAGLKRLQKKVYAACSDWREGFQDPKYDTDLKVETRKTTGEQILSNSLIALRLPPASGTKPLPAASCPAPILAVRGPDNVWFGKGSLISDRTVQSFKCEETEKGPIFKEFKITYVFAPKDDAEETKTDRGHEEYQLIIRLFARRDYVMVTERMIGEVEAVFRFSLSENLNADVVLHATGGVPRFEQLSDQPAEEEETLAVLRAWNASGLRRSHNWYGVMSSGGRNDAVGILQVNGASWQFRGRGLWADNSWLIHAADKEEMRVAATKERDLFLDFPYRLGTRQFALAVFDKTRNWTPATLRAAKLEEPRMHYLNRLHIQLSQVGILGMGEMRADRAHSSGRPHLLFNARTFPALKERFEKDPSAFPIVLHDVFTGSRAHTPLVRAQVLYATNALQQAFLGQWDERNFSGFSGRGVNPKALEPIIKYTALLYDAHSRSGLFSEREKEIIFATFALVAAQLESPNWSPAFAHDPAAAAARDSAITMISLLLDKHPGSMSRILAARQRLQASLVRIYATGGIPFESSLALAALNTWAEMTPVLENAAEVLQVGSSPFQLPQFTNMLATLPFLVTPPDKRYGGLRLFPTVGTCGVEDAESLAVAGVAAAKFAPGVPKLAEHLAWVWGQADRPLFQAGARHRALLRILDPEEPPKIDPKPPEAAHSAALPGYGALMRTKFAKPDEAYLLFKCSPWPNSLHQDQGSLLFYAFGAPLLVDPPAPPGRSAAWSHSTVRIGNRSHRSPGRIVQFAEQDQDNFVVGEFKVEALSQFKEHTASELAAAAKAAKAANKPYVPPPGHLADGAQTSLMLPMLHKLEKPVLIRRAVIFNKSYQYLVVYDRISGYEATDVFYNVFANDARIKDNMITFAGPFGVDLTVHAFGPKEMKISLDKDAAQRWTLRLSQPAPPAPPAPAKLEKKDEKTGETEEAVEDEDEEEPEPPTTEYFTVLCPSRRRLPGDSKDVVERAAPKIERLKGLRAVRISYGKSVRYIFIANKEITYEHDGLVFKGTRGIVTLRPTHFDVALFDAGEVRYQGRGVKTNHGMVRFTVMPGGFVSGQTSGPDHKRLTFYDLGRPPRRISYRVDGMEFLGDGDGEEAVFGTTGGAHTISIQPK